MSTYAAFYLGRGEDAKWLGTLQRDSDPDGLARVDPGRLALGATDPDSYRAAVESLLDVWEGDEIGFAYCADGRGPSALPDVDYAYAFDGDRVWIGRTRTCTWEPAPTYEPATPPNQ
jgi:hypothetical protein